MKFKPTLFFIATFIYSFSFAQIKFKDLKIDTTITGFHSTGDTLQLKSFFKQGVNSSFSFNIMRYADYEGMKDDIEHTVDIIKQYGYKITDVAERDTTLNGYKAFYMFYTDSGKTEKNYRDISFVAFVIKDRTVIFFQSHDLDNGLFAEKFKETFFSIKI